MSIQEIISQTNFNQTQLSWLIMIFGKILEGASTEIFKKLEQTESHLDEKDYLIKFRDMTIEVNASCSKVIFEVC